MSQTLTPPMSAVRRSSQKAEELCVLEATLVVQLGSAYFPFTGPGSCRPGKVCRKNAQKHHQRLADDACCLRCRLQGNRDARHPSDLKINAAGGVLWDIMRCWGAEHPSKKLLDPNSYRGTPLVTCTGWGEVLCSAVDAEHYSAEPWTTTVLKVCLLTSGQITTLPGKRVDAEHSRKEP